jgi:heme exporter protein D
MLSNISDLFTMASLAICMLLSGIIFYYLRTRINMLEQSVMEQAQLLQQVLRHSQNQQQQQQQQIAMMAGASTTTTPVTTVQNSLQQQQQQRLIPVSDDSESDDSESDDDDDYDDSDDDDDDDGDGNLHRSKSIDLSAIMSNAQLPSSSNFFENNNGSSSNTEIKVIELKHCFSGGNDDGIEYCLRNGDDNHSDSEGDSDSDSESDSDSDSSDGDNGNESEGHVADKGSSNKNDSKNDDKKKHLDKLKKGAHSAHSAHSSLDVAVPLKNMPVNMLRDLAKTKLTQLEQSAINKMSKKEILKALDS